MLNPASSEPQSLENLASCLLPLNGEEKEADGQDVNFIFASFKPPYILNPAGCLLFIKIGDVVKGRHLQIQQDDIGPKDPGEGSLLPSQGDTIFTKLASAMCQPAPSSDGAANLSSMTMEGAAERKALLKYAEFWAEDLGKGFHAGISSVAYLIWKIDVLNAYDHALPHLVDDDEVDLDRAEYSRVFYAINDM
ncbi:hypothetical protein L7F22_047483 [Adiantum nelumboides]|nr:hypothetical protein [Adiantum nelumboides]